MVLFCSIQTQIQTHSQSYCANAMSFRQLFHFQILYKQFESNLFRIFTYLHLWHIKMNIQLQSQCKHTLSYLVCFCFNFISNYLQTIKFNDYTTTLFFMLTNSFFTIKLTSEFSFYYLKLIVI